MSTQNQIRDVLNRHYDYPSQKLAFKACLDDLTNLFKEERRAALAALTGLPARGTMNYRRGYEEGLRDAIRTLEAAANETKGEDGDDG